MVSRRYYLGAPIPGDGVHSADNGMETARFLPVSAVPVMRQHVKPDCRCEPGLKLPIRVDLGGKVVDGATFPFEATKAFDLGPVMDFSLE